MQTYQLQIDTAAGEILHEVSGDERAARNLAEFLVCHGYWVNETTLVAPSQIHAVRVVKVPTPTV